MCKRISIISAGLLAIGILVVGGPVQAALDHASVGAYGTADFDNDAAGGPDATIDYVVVYKDGGISLTHLNDNVFTGTDLTSAADVAGSDEEAGALGSMQTFDTDANLAFFYQIDSTTNHGDIGRLLIRDFGFTPTSAGYFEDVKLAISGTTGTLSETAGLKTPTAFADGITLTDGTDGVRWTGMDSGGTGLTNTESAPLFYMTFDEAGAGTGWHTMYSGNEVGGSGSRTGSLPSPNPEPGSLALLGAAVAGFGGFRRFRRRRNAEQESEEIKADATTTPELD